MKKFWPQLFKTQSTASTPESGVLALYAKSDGFYFKDENGNEYQLTASVVASYLVDELGNFLVDESGNKLKAL